MPKDKTPTKNEHYIPRFHFRNFSKEKKGIYRSEVQNSQNPSVWVSIEKECKQNNLYEFINNNGEIVVPNYIENILRNWEADISQRIKCISQRALDYGNCKNKFFLTDDEQLYLLFYLGLQITRTPQIIKWALKLRKKSIRM